MSQIYIKPVVAYGPPSSKNCAEFDFNSAISLNAISNMNLHWPDLDKSFYGLSGFVSECEIYDEATEEKVKLFYPEYGTPLIDSFTRNEIEHLPEGQYKLCTLKQEMFQEVYHGHVGDIDNDPVEENKRIWREFRERYFDNNTQDIYLYKQVTVNEQGQQTLYQAVTKGQQLERVDTPKYFTCSGNYSMRYVATGGRYDLRFGVRNQSVLIPGASYTEFSFGPQDGWSSSGYSIEVGSNYYFPSSSIGGMDHAAVAGGSSNYNQEALTTQEVVKLGNAMPIHFTIPAGTTIDGHTFPSDIVMFGICGYTTNYTDTSKPGNMYFVAIDDKQWKTAQQRKIDFGDDTDPAGGTGAFTPGTDNTIKDTEKAGKYGLSNNPLLQTGFFIYKMTENELSSFLKSAASGGGFTTAASWSTEDITTWLTGLTGQVSSLIGSKTIVDNIVFIYRSPLDFPTVQHTIASIPVGNSQIKNGNDVWNVKCVTKTLLQAKVEPDDNEVLWCAQSFVDLEPYSSTWISVPFCESVPIPPSFLYNSKAEIQVVYELVTRSANASIVLTKNNSINKFSAAGECAVVSPTVFKTSSIASDFVSTAASFAPTVATIASGGAVSPALIGTAAGAALGFLATPHTDTVSSIPSSSSGSPYWDTINRGTQDVTLYGAKTDRLTSGEKEDGLKTKIQGHKSFYAVDNLSSVGEGNYVQITDVQVPMTGGMTLAEHDKIVALLRQGVIL